MKRFALFLAVPLFCVVGCDSPSPAPKAAEPAKKVEAAPAPAPAPAAPAAPAAKPAAPKAYFEMKKDGKWYVTQDQATLAAIGAGNVPADMVAKPGLGAHGETVYFPAKTTDPIEALVAEFQKNHPKPE